MTMANHHFGFLHPLLARRMSTLFFQILLGLILFATTSHAQKAFAETIKIGISVPLSGNAAQLGRQFVSGAQFALKHLELENELSLIFSDDGCSSELAQLAAEDLVAAKVSMIGGYLCNEAVFTAVEITKNSNIPLVVSGARANRITQDAKRYGWNVWQMAERDENAPRAAAQYFKNEWANLPFAVVDDGTISGRTQIDEFRARMEEAGLKPVFIDNIRPAQSTHAGLIRRLRKADVKAVYLAASAQDVATVAKNMGEIGLEAMLVVPDTIALLPFEEEPVELQVGTFGIMIQQPEEHDGVKALKDTFDRNRLEIERYLLEGYATIQLISQMIKTKSGAYAGKTYSTILGDVVFDEQGRNRNSEYKIYRWDGEKFEIVN